MLSATGIVWKMLKSDSLFQISRVYTRNYAQCLAGHCPRPGTPRHRCHRTLQGDFLSSSDHCCTPDCAQGWLSPSRKSHPAETIFSTGRDSTGENLGMLGCGGLILRKNQAPALSLVLAVLPCGAQAVSGAGRCSLLDFLSWLCYSCRRGSFGLHTVYVVLSITTQSAHLAQTKKINQKWCCTAPAGQEGGIWATKLSVIQVLLPDPPRAAAQAGQQPLSPVCQGMLVPGPGHTCAHSKTHHRLQTEPAEQEVCYSTLKEDEKLRGGLVQCQRQMKRSQSKT